MNQPDPYADWDAAYVLGALTVQQRHEYEDHLAGCEACRQAVGELAAMPGLLAQLPAAEAIALSDHRAATRDTGPVPDSIRNLTPPRSLTRNRLLMVAAVVLVLIIGGIGGFVLRGAVSPEPAGDGSAIRVAFVPDHPTGMLAVADLAPDGQRTKIDIDCMYASGYSHRGHYALEVVDDRGNRVRGPDWTAGAGDRETPSTWAALPLGRIRSLEIVYADSGSVVMRAAVG